MEASFEALVEIAKQVLEDDEWEPHYIPEYDIYEVNGCFMGRKAYERFCKLN